MKTMVLKTVDNLFFKDYTTFGCEFTPNRKEAKKYAGENLEMLIDECNIRTLVFPAFYSNGKFVHEKQGG